MPNLKLTLASSLAAVSLSFQARANIINFDGLADSSVVGNTYAGQGVHVNHGVILVAGISLNEISFPPHSGTGVMTDDGSPIYISFDAPVDNVSAYFAYVSLLTFTAFDGVGNVLGTLNSPSSSFTDANQLISLGISGISALQISGQTPSSFILDDFTFQPQVISGVPDTASTALLLAFAGLALFSGAKFFHCGRVN